MIMEPLFEQPLNGPSEPVHIAEQWSLLTDLTFTGKGDSYTPRPGHGLEHVHFVVNSIHDEYFTARVMSLAVPELVYDPAEDMLTVKQQLRIRTYGINHYHEPVYAEFNTALACVYDTATSISLPAEALPRRSKVDINSIKEFADPGMYNTDDVTALRHVTMDRVRNSSLVYICTLPDRHLTTPHKIVRSLANDGEVINKLRVNPSSMLTVYSYDLESPELYTLPV